jgi:hypothetical protein
MKRPTITAGIPSDGMDTSYTCPYCGVLQAAATKTEDMGAVAVTLKQCVNCKDITILGKLYATSAGGNRYPQAEEYPLFPEKQIRPPEEFQYCPPEVEKAYKDACYLFHIHPGASGAYARRALELILEQAGYAGKTLADSISLAEKESDPDRKLNKGIIANLNYVKEIGNFALHIRRDDELVIVDISPEEVSACLETIEELIGRIFEDAGLHYQRLAAMNEKLKAAGKKEIPLPAKPGA